MAPIIGRAWVGYIPGRRVVGISKLAGMVESGRVICVASADGGFSQLFPLASTNSDTTASASRGR